MEIIELLTPAYESAWLPWAVSYFFLIGVAVGAALLVSICAFSRTEGAGRQLLPTFILVLAMTAITAPIALLADLHQPARFWHFYAHFTPWSWMSLGALLLPLFFLLSILMCVLWWLGQIRWMRLLAPVLMLSALSISLYTGMEIMVIRARPLWNTGWVPINLMLTGWLATIGWSFMLYRILPRRLQPDTPALIRLRQLGLTIAILLGIAALSWAIAGEQGYDKSYAQALQLFTQFSIWRISMFVSAVLGVLVLAGLAMGKNHLHSKLYTLGLGIGLAVAAWVFRWALFMSVQTVPKFGAGLYLYSMPLGSDGLLGILGVGGLCIAITGLFIAALEIYPERQLALKEVMS